MGLNYKEAGVDKEAGYKQVELIKDLVKRTYNQGVLSDIGGFAGLFQLDSKKYDEPVLVSATDGVGTKLKIAFMMDRHNTIGEDCVAMCINDILCQGARPLFFLDYIATAKLVPKKMAAIVEGVSNGCIKGEAALIGGETAEMPGLYNEGEYDIAGFAVGLVDKKDIIDGKDVKEGDILIGLPSSGIHSNGYSLVRKIVFEIMGLQVDDYIAELGSTLGEELLKPTRIYTRVILPLVENFKLKGLVHITGGGFYENIARIVADGLMAKIDTSKIDRPKIFDLLAKWGKIDEKEMYSTFNMGVGMVIIIGKNDKNRVLEQLDKQGEKYYLLGSIEKGEEKVQLW